jgi:4a-hydroxytetrahydrobiopterin dehydratase
MSVLNASEIETIIKENAGWRLDSGKLVRDWEFKDFVQAMVFVNRVANLAESAGHHPDIDIRYNRVRLGLISHDAGGITRRDADMVRRLQKEFS